MDYRMPAKHFKDLLAWQAAYALTIHIYGLVARFPASERYGLTSQIKRAYAIAHGSLTEVENQLIVAHGVGYISEEELRKAEKLTIEAHKLLYGLRKSNRQKGAVTV